MKGPYVTLSRDYQRGKTLTQLLDAGLGHPDLNLLEWPFGENPLYLHQERAFRKVDQENRNAIVKTVIGSGKTESFMLPVLSGISRLREEGVGGTKAILMYPMNALAND